MPKRRGYGPQGDGLSPYKRMARRPGSTRRPAKRVTEDSPRFHPTPSFNPRRRQDGKKRYA